MKLYRPLRPSLNYPSNRYSYNRYLIPPSVVSQFFGENRYCVRPDDTTFSSQGNTCPAGSESGYKKFWNLAGHNGLDIPCRRGDLVFAAHDGVVSRIEGNKDIGYGIRILSDEVFEFEGRKVRLETVYWHLIPMFINKEGARIKAGNFIGLADSTGYSTGDHLHFGAKLRLPDGSVLENEFGGAYNPLIWLEEKDAIDVYGENYGNLYKLAQLGIANLFRYVAKIRFGNELIEFDESLL